MPGDNWAKKVGKALASSELMVVLLTPKGRESDCLRHDIDFALGSRKYEHRVFSVLAGVEAKASKDVPWILLKLPHCQVESAEEFRDAVRKIQALGNGSYLSHSHA